MISTDPFGQLFNITLSLFNFSSKVAEILSDENTTNGTTEENLSFDEFDEYYEEF